MGALAILFVLDIYLWLALLIGATLVVSMLFVSLQTGWLDADRIRRKTRWQFLPRALQSVTFGGDGVWRLIFTDGQQQDAILTSTGCISPVLTILNFKLEAEPWLQRHRALVLLADAIEGEDFRRLRLLLQTHQNQ